MQYCIIFIIIVRCLHATGMLSANCSLSSSWIYYQGSPGSNLSIPQNRSQQTSPGSQLSAVSSVDFIENEHSLMQYLQDYGNFEKTAAVGKVLVWNIVIHVTEYIKIIFMLLFCQFLSDHVQSVMSKARISM